MQEAKVGTEAQQIASKEFSTASIKKALKTKTKSELIGIITELAKKVDLHKERLEKIGYLVNEINGEGGFVEYADYSNLMEKVGADV